jgi:hypothetical protein
MSFLSLYDPRLLKKEAREQPLKVFLCGPGHDSDRFKFRDNIRTFLLQNPNVKTLLGEGLDIEKHGLKPGDLQTVEAAFAHTVDFTVLLLESPGAIAELGTFSMMPSLRPRLFVMVPSRYFRSESYIARGPLSAIGKEHVNNIIYFDESRQRVAIEHLRMPITLFKFAKTVDPFFQEVSSKANLRFYRTSDFYQNRFGIVKDQFWDLIVLVAIIVLDAPTFPSIVSTTKLDPGDTKRSLGRLFNSSSIQKEGGSRYKSLLSFNDPLLKNVDTTFLSQLRSKYLAAA